MMRRDGVHDVFVFACALQQFRADGRMRAFDFMVNRLADVMQQAGPLRLPFVQTDGSRDGPHHRRHFDGVHQHVLREAVTVFEAANQIDDVRTQTGNAQLRNRFLPRLLDFVLHFLLHFVHHLFDARGMDTAIRHKTFHRNAGDFAADRIKARNNNGFWRVVD